MTGDITPVEELLTRYREHFAHANYGPVRQWLADGADMEKDILSVIRHWIKQKPDSYSLGFFAPHVRESRDARRRKSILTPRQRAERIAFRRKVGQRHPTDERWLAGYEAVHGPVVV